MTNKERFIPKRLKTANKGTYGKLLVIAGSFAMAGAAYLSACAAYRLGAGMVKICTTEKNRTILQTLLPEALMCCYEEDRLFEEKTKQRIYKELDWSDYVIIGPGLSREPYAYELVRLVLAYYKKPIIIDADALYILSDKRELLGFLSYKSLITPHIKEMSRLIDKESDYVDKAMEEDACLFSERYNCHTVLKSYRTVVVSADLHIKSYNISTPALAKAGSGDVLTGIIAGLLCIGFSMKEAAAHGIYIQSEAAKKAAHIYGEHSVLARDIIEQLAAVIKEHTSLI